MNKASEIKKHIEIDNKFSTTRMLYRNEEDYKSPKNITSKCGGIRTKGYYKKTSINLPLITIITVVKNASIELERTIRSVLKQSYENIEYIIVDGASNDNTMDKVLQFENCIDFWISESDDGVYFAMNKAISFAKGEWINFMNAGDVFHDKNSVKNIFCKNLQDVDFIYGNHNYLINAQHVQFCKAKVIEDQWIQLKNGNINLSWLQGFPCHQSQFVKVEILKTKKFDTNFKIVADQHFMFSLLGKKTKFYKTEEIISDYMGGGLSQKQDVKCIREQWKLVKLYKKNLKIDLFFVWVICYILGSRNIFFRLLKKTIELLPGFSRLNS